MNTLVVILGQYGSGTSAAASIVHRLGFPVATWTPPPYPPKWRMEYQDQALDAKLAEVCPWGKAPEPDPSLVPWLRDYFRDRLEHAAFVSEAVDFPAPGIAIKNPDLSLVMPAVREAALQVGLTVRVIVTARESASVIRSITERHGRLFPERLGALKETNRLIGAALKLEEDRHLIHYEAMVRSPVYWTGKVAEYLGVGQEQVAAAAAMIEGT